MRIDAIVLIVGLTFLLTALILVAMVRNAIRPRIDARRRLDSKSHQLTSRLKQMLPAEPHHPPADTRPAMIGAIRGEQVDASDVNVSLIDLASKGYLTITPLNERADSWRDWVFTKAKEADASLLPYEATLLDAPFGGKDSVTHSRMLLSSTKPLDRAQAQLVQELQQKNWVEGDEPRSSVWGILGGLVLLTGLILTAAMIFDWLTTSSMFGLVGSVALATSGGVIVSLGKSWYRPESMEAVAKQLDRYEHQILNQKLKANTLAKTFSQDLPWAIGLGISEQLAKKYDDFLASHPKCPFKLGWYRSAKPYSAASLVEDLNQLVSGAS